MKDLFISYEIALKLKELGFDENCLAGYFQYTENSKPFLITPSTKYSYIPFYGKYCNQNKHIIKAPLIYQVFEWFREQYGLDVNYIFCIPNSYKPTIHFTKEEGLKYKSNKMLNFFDRKIFDSKKEAELESIKFLIKLINEKV